MSFYQWTMLAFMAVGQLSAVAGGGNFADKLYKQTLIVFLFLIAMRHTA